MTTNDSERSEQMTMNDLMIIKQNITTKSIIKKYPDN